MNIRKFGIVQEAALTTVMKCAKEAPIGTVNTTAYLGEQIKTNFGHLMSPTKLDRSYQRDAYWALRFLSDAIRISKDPVGKLEMVKLCEVV